MPNFRELFRRNKAIDWEGILSTNERKHTKYHAREQKLYQEIEELIAPFLATVQATRYKIEEENLNTGIELQFIPLITKLQQKLKQTKLLGADDLNICLNNLARLKNRIHQSNLYLMSYPIQAVMGLYPPRSSMIGKDIFESGHEINPQQNVNNVTEVLISLIAELEKVLQLISERTT